MKLIFLDESGYSRNWKSDIADQPVHVLGAVALDASSYPEVCERLRTEIIGVRGFSLPYPLGQGAEIKAKEVSAGKGWWKKNKKQRNEIRELMLSFPLDVGGTTFLVVIDKQRHKDRYVSPDDPSDIAFQYMFERLQWYLIREHEVALCIYDQTKFLDDKMYDDSTSLIRDGSPVEYWHEYYGHVQKKFSIDRVAEFYLGASINSVGLQLADFLAHFGYQYHKSGMPSDCGWWGTL